MKTLPGGENSVPFGKMLSQDFNHGKAKRSTTGSDYFHLSISDNALF